MEMVGGYYWKEWCLVEVGGKKLKLFIVFYVFLFIRIYNKMYKVYLMIVFICIDF